MYKSPIEIAYGQLQTQIDGDVFRAVQSYGINVDKEELIKALAYDRDQYNKGYGDAMATIAQHGRWHIMPEDPYDESECPTEEGWYRIITTDGEEMTDYFFPEPTLIGRGVVYWKNCKKAIRAWAKMDGKGEGE